MAKGERLLLAVREVLFLEWDPLSVNGNELCRNEYDNHAPTICRWLGEGVDESKLAKYLSQLQRVSMGRSIIDEESDRRIAQRLLRLVK
jgi:hypothetical protein